MKQSIIYLFAFSSFLGFSQASLEDLLKKYNNKSIPYISVHQLSISQNKTLILDAREQSEYNISHIKDAIFVGYDNFK